MFNINNRHEILIIVLYHCRHVVKLLFPINIRTIEVVTPHTQSHTTSFLKVSLIGIIHQRSMSRLIGQLLHITRLEQGTQKLETESADLSELARSVCTAQAQLAPRGITLTCDAPDPVTLPLDVTLMTRLLNNLISNAFRYGRDGGHTAVSVVREGDTAVLSVADDGIGIPPALQERIWQRFYQVDPARSGSEGTGLGLFMVRQIARLHGGTAEVSSIPGQGSTFTVRLPMA